MNALTMTAHRRPHWRKSSYSAGEGQCVEVAAVGGRVRLRESDDPGTVLTTVPAVLAAFVSGAKAGAFDV
ncbi:DUF397 domain-containing protein [Streptomyces sp. NPDC044780]|uniref:DUF397 domain-containing protein n=1 Tax=Streptomyces luomodiensis TaxID=3026192 RepID=A0ABY9UWA1_9ACTN|nr:MULTISPECIES: DUF397 domain-containing protein [unclassified Streptomyces]WAP56251.1 DUF397 domain-containing protein [Streptomyces sp. S465]WNE96808.1 DUF397 domain-containing protein [Streptomyces sp. SCA4-21]